jgi:hypothetical protein
MLITILMFFIVNQDQANLVALINEEIIALEDDDDEAEGEEVCALTGKRKKRCTSAVWQHFTKKIETVEVDGRHMSSCGVTATSQSANKGTELSLPMAQMHF